MTTTRPAPAGPQTLPRAFVTPEEFTDYWHALASYFLDDPREEDLEADRSVAEYDRFFGFREDGRWVSTAGAYTRRLAVPGAVVPTAAVTVVTVAPTHRRRGLLTAMMRDQLDDVRAAATEPLAALWASESVIYGRFGYGPASQRAQLSGATRSLRFRPDVDFGTGTLRMVSRDELLSRAAPAYDVVAAGTVGRLDRDPRWWDYRFQDAEHRRDGAGPMHYLLHTEADGSATGWAVYRVRQNGDITGPKAELRIADVGATNRRAYASIWRFLIELDLVRTFDYWAAGVDEPLHHMVTDPRTIHTEVSDALYVRLVDVGRALAARGYACDVDVVLEVADAFCPWNAGRYRLRGGVDGAECGRTDAAADLMLSSLELGTAYLGGVSLGVLAAAGRVVERTPGALARTSAAFGWPLRPVTPDPF